MLWGVLEPTGLYARLHNPTAECSILQSLKPMKADQFERSEQAMLGGRIPRLSAIFMLCGFLTFVAGIFLEEVYGGMMWVFFASMVLFFGRTILA